MKLANKKAAENVTKRGNVPTTLKEKGEQAVVGPVLLGFFIFVVAGSGATLPSAPHSAFFGPRKTTRSVVPQRSRPFFCSRLEWHREGREGHAT